MPGPNKKKVNVKKDSALSDATQPLIPQNDEIDLVSNKNIKDIAVKAGNLSSMAEGVRYHNILVFLTPGELDVVGQVSKQLNKETKALILKALNHKDKSIEANNKRTYVLNDIRFVRALRELVESPIVSSVAAKKVNSKTDVLSAIKNEESLIDNTLNWCNLCCSLGCLCTGVAAGITTLCHPGSLAIGCWIATGSECLIAITAAFGQWCQESNNIKIKNDVDYVIKRLEELDLQSHHKNIYFVDSAHQYVANINDQKLVSLFFENKFGKSSSKAKKSKPDDGPPRSEMS